MFRKVLFILAACLVLAACAPAATVTPIDASISLTDGLGRGVNLAGPAQRVVSLAAANTEVLFAIGAGSQVVGRDYFSDYPPEATALPDIGGSMGEYNLEAIACPAAGPGARRWHKPTRTGGHTRRSRSHCLLFTQPGHAGRDVYTAGDGRPIDRSPG